MSDVLQRIYEIGIVPVIAIDDAEKAVPLAKALVRGGLPAAEVTFRTAAAEEAIRRIVAEVPDMLVGAGTVLTKEQADRAIDAGVSFIVSPGFNPEITKYVLDKGMLMIPGTASPGEMEQAMGMGLSVVKFFPAEQNGGVAKLKEKFKDVMDIQIIAFPQEGIIQDPGCDKLMYEAMENGCTIVGGMPANEKTPADSLAHVKLCFDIAEKYDADIDMHVDETDDPFYRTLEMVADETIKRGWEGRVTAGHTCALAAYDDHYANYVIEKVARAKMNIITNPVTNLMLQGRLDKQPIRRGITRVKELLAAGVNVSFGQDCIKDTFYPYGSADMLQVANVTAHAAQMSLPPEIEKVYDMITYDAAKILGLKGYGLEPGCEANLVVVNAKDARDAIRLNPERLYVIRKGKVVAQTKVETELFL